MEYGNFKKEKAGEGLGNTVVAGNGVKKLTPKILVSVEDFQKVGVEPPEKAISIQKVLKFWRNQWRSGCQHTYTFEPSL